MEYIDYYLNKAINKAIINKDIESQQKELGELKKGITGAIKNKKNFNYFYPQEDSFQKLPENSVLIKIPFTLKKPYTSKGEDEFCLLPDWVEDKEKKPTYNPIIRDKFFDCPMVRPSSWKGHLRYAAEMIEEGYENKKTNIIERLFGFEDIGFEEKDALKGRLYFFPTFFYEESKRDVITPLNRKTRTPTSGPIDIEIMNRGSKGEFHLLYFPYPGNKESKNIEVKEDLIFLTEALALMFYTYGFSAKKTSGFGVIEKELDGGKIWFKSKLKVLPGDFNTLNELKIKIDELWSKVSE